jgi:transposase-like protein
MPLLFESKEDEQHAEEDRSDGQGAVREAGAGALAGVLLIDPAAEVVARREGLGKETVRRWALHAQIDGGQRQGATSEELAEIKDLKAKVRRLEEDNDISRRASTFFAGELDPRGGLPHQPPSHPSGAGHLLADLTLDADPESTRPTRRAPPEQGQANRRTRPTDLSAFPRCHHQTRRRRGREPKRFPREGSQERGSAA